MKTKLLLISIFIFTLSCNNKTDDSIRNSYQKENENYQTLLNSGKYSLEAFKLGEKGEKYFKNLIEQAKEKQVINETENYTDDELYKAFKSEVLNLHAFFYDISSSFNSLYQELLEKCPDILSIKSKGVYANFDLLNVKTSLNSKQVLIYRVLTEGISNNKLNLLEIVKALRDRALSISINTGFLEKLTKNKFIEMKDSYLGDIAHFFVNNYVDGIFVKQVIESTLYFDFLNQMGVELITDVDSREFDESYKKDFISLVKKDYTVNFYISEKLEFIKDKGFANTTLKAVNKGYIIELKKGGDLIRFIMNRLSTKYRFEKHFFYKEGIIKKTRKFKSSFFGGDKPFDPNLYFKKD